MAPLAAARSRSAKSQAALLPQRIDVQRTNDGLRLLLFFQRFISKKRLQQRSEFQSNVAQLAQEFRAPRDENDVLGAVECQLDCSRFYCEGSVRVTKIFAGFLLSAAIG